MGLDLSILVSIDLAFLSPKPTGVQPYDNSHAPIHFPRIPAPSLLQPFNSSLGVGLLFFFVPSQCILSQLWINTYQSLTFSGFSSRRSLSPTFFFSNYSNPSSLPSAYLFFFPSSQFINSIFVTLIEKKNSISATNSPLPSVSGWWCSRRTRPAPTSPKQRTSMRRPITVFPFSAIELGNDGEGKIELRRGEEVTEKLDARYEANLGEKSPWKIKAWEHRSQAKQREMRQLPRQKADSSSKHPDQKRTQTINSSVVSPDRNWKLLKTTNYLFLLPG